MSSYSFESDRLNFRLLTEEDTPYLIALDSDPDVRYYLPGGVQTKEQTKARIIHILNSFEENNLPCFVVFEKKTREFVGKIRFKNFDKSNVEISFLLHKKFWGKGYASEILSTLLQWARKEIPADEIIAMTAIEHIASQKVLQKCGMERYKNETLHNVDYCFYKIKNKHL